ncbi:MAG: Hsp20/alpha crystallin family protein [Bacillota bacterium]
MFLSLLDLMRWQTGRPLREMALPAGVEPEWREEGAHLVLRVPLEGIDPSSVQIQVSESSLSLAGCRTREERLEGPGWYRSSASYGAFARTWPLPARVRPRESQATWQGAVLEIRLRKA